MKSKRSVLRQSLLTLATGGVALSMLGAGVARADDSAPQGRSIGYAFTLIYWSLYETKDAKEECPGGLNAMGPREQFKALFPEDGTKRKLVDAQLAREAEVFWPDTSPEPFPVPAAVGKIAPGFNLDGKVKPADFTSPQGVPGVDNQMFRALGCIKNYRTGGPLYNYDTEYSKKGTAARLMIELTDVDSLVNDDDVTLTTYRGQDPLMTDATGATFQPGGTERLDLRFGQAFIHKTKAKIVNGVLISQPMEFHWPTSGGIEQWVRDARFEVKLAPDSAEGLVGGYVDIENFYGSRIRNYTTHFHAYGQQAQASTYKIVKKMADAYPDPKTGEFTAISAAFNVKLVQVRVLHPDQKISELQVGPPVKQAADSRVAVK